MAPTTTNKIEKTLNNGFKLVAELSIDPEIPEIYVGLENPEGIWVQDLTVVRPKYEISKKDGNIKIDNNTMEMLIYGDELSEDYTHRFTVGIYEQEKEE